MKTNRGISNLSIHGTRASVNAYIVAVIGALLIVAGLVWVMGIYTKPQPLGTERADLRKKTWTALKAENQEVLFGNYAWQDQKKGMVRLPINRATV